MESLIEIDVWPNQEFFIQEDVAVLINRKNLKEESYKKKLMQWDLLLKMETDSNKLNDNNLIEVL